MHDDLLDDVEMVGEAGHSTSSSTASKLPSVKTANGQVLSLVIRLKSWTAA